MGWQKRLKLNDEKPEVYQHVLRGRGDPSERNSGVSETALRQGNNQRHGCLHLHLQRRGERAFTLWVSCFTVACIAHIAPMSWTNRITPCSMSIPGLHTAKPYGPCAVSGSCLHRTMVPSCLFREHVCVVMWYFCCAIRPDGDVVAVREDQFIRPDCINGTNLFPGNLTFGYMHALSSTWELLSSVVHPAAVDFVFWPHWLRIFRCSSCPPCLACWACYFCGGK